MMPTRMIWKSSFKHDARMYTQNLLHIAPIKLYDCVSFYT